MFFMTFWILQNMLYCIIICKLVGIYYLVFSIWFSLIFVYLLLGFITFIKFWKLLFSFISPHSVDVFLYFNMLYLYWFVKFLILLFVCILALLNFCPYCFVRITILCGSVYFLFFISDLFNGLLINMLVYLALALTLV